MFIHSLHISVLQGQVFFVNFSSHREKQEAYPCHCTTSALPWQKERVHEKWKERKGLSGRSSVCSITAIIRVNNFKPDLSD